VRSKRRSVFVVRRDVAELAPAIDAAGEIALALEDLGRLDPAEIDRHLAPAAGKLTCDLAVFDLETLGFWGCPIFLAGFLVEESGRLVTLQLLALDYPEEALVLRAAEDVLRERSLLVSFNGKSYDVPCFRERCAYHGIPSSIDELAHVDVLHPARRRYRESLPDCRLVTLERHVAGIYRQGDVPSAEVPAVYHRFVATGEIDALAPVLHHSRVDLLTTGMLLARLTSDAARTTVAT
jgi:uncharacterized protein YprB with RNaseH-like and TPR domain